MLSSFTIKNFKSYREATLKLAPLTVLIGANASGKSNAIEALRLLSWIAEGKRLGAIRRDLLEKERAIRGDVGDLSYRAILDNPLSDPALASVEQSGQAAGHLLSLGYRGVPAFSFSCRTTDAHWHDYSITLEAREGDELHIYDERLGGGGLRSFAPLFEVVTPSKGALGDMYVAYNNFARGGRKPQIACSDQTAALCQLMTSARFQGGHKKAQTEIPAVTSRLHRWLSDITLLDPRPSLMRSYSFRSEHLAESGSNLSGVLYNLCKEQGKKDELLEFVQALPEQDITKIDFIGTPRGEVMVSLTETFGGSSTPYEAPLLSDGTLRVLAIAAGILSSRGPVVVIEEIDNGVHPSRAAQLLDQMSRIAKERNLRVLISSHNPALLNAVPDDAVPAVVFCYRDPEYGSSRLTRLSDIPDYPELIAQGSVGHLMTRGIIERFVKDHPGPEQRKQRAHAWLDELRKQVG